MALFTLADLHLSLSTDKPMDVFGSGWSNYIAKIREYWHYMVSPSDTVVVPGDISWAMNLEELKADFTFLHALPGKKILLKGNHDYWWNSLTKLENFTKENAFSSIRFLQNNAFFAENKILCGSRGWICEDKMTQQDLKVLEREAIRFQLSIDEGKRLQKEEEESNGSSPEIICFSHFPIVTMSQRTNPILEVLKKNGIEKVYFGHLHNLGGKTPIEEKDGISFTLVSSDYREFTPVRIN